MSKAIDWKAGDMVTWQELSTIGTLWTYEGTVRDCLSTQLLVHTKEGSDRFVMYNNPTLKPYRQVV